jgi:phosphoenolpyruvate-protein kinase (PTS system EI component)
VSATVQEVSVGSTTVVLTEISNELLTLSQALQQVEKRLEPLERSYEEDFADFEAGMFKRYEDGEGKWPGEETRERLYRRTMPQESRQELMRLQAARKRAEKRISSLKAAADAQRSILSALKVEMEATR